MLDLAQDLVAWVESGRRVAVATLVRVEGSAPRTVGSSLAVADDGAVLGSLSGGCVDGAVHDRCRELLDGVGDAGLDAYDGDGGLAPGLTCGGRVQVLVQLLDPAATEPLRRAAAGLDARLELRHGDEVVLVEHRPAAPRMLVAGATQEAAALCTLAAGAGYRVTVVDPRPVFATKDRFPDAAEVVCAWPQEHVAEAGLDARGVAVLLAHDERVDPPFLAAALAGPAGFVGAMGSRRTHERRLAALRELGVDDAALARLHSPVGLRLGATTPFDTAVSIYAEVVAARSGASGRPLRDDPHPVHGEDA
jgi:xanthine dehydrogenase accessory factor